MPTVINERGFQFRIYTREHPPAHVHVWHQGYEAIIEFRDEIVIRDVTGGLAAETLPE